MGSLRPSADRAVAGLSLGVQAGNLGVRAGNLGVRAGNLEVPGTNLGASWVDLAEHRSSKLDDSAGGEVLIMRTC